MLPTHSREWGETWTFHEKDGAVAMLKGIERKEQVSSQEVWKAQEQLQDSNGLTVPWKTSNG